MLESKNPQYSKNLEELGRNELGRIELGRKITYHSCRICERLEVEVVHAEPLLNHVPELRVCPIMDLRMHLRIRGMNKDDDGVIMEIFLHKSKESSKVGSTVPIPMWNILIGPLCRFPLWPFQVLGSHSQWTKLN